MAVTVGSVRQFLADAGFDVDENTTGAFDLIAQNRSMIIFVSEVSDGLAASVASALRHLTQPFQSKSFGTKTMEMYVVFVSKSTLPLEEIEKCERDMRVFRKIVLTAEDDLGIRLAALRPLDDVTSLTPDLESTFWAEIATRLKPGEMTVLRQLSEQPGTAPEKLMEKLGEIG